MKYIIYLFAIIGFVLVAGYTAQILGFTKAKSAIDVQQDTFIAGGQNATSTSWNQGEEWQVFLAALRKDSGIITRSAQASDTDPRVIVSILAVEQLRLFHTEREYYERVFAPLKILGVQSQFSWGVMGIKKETAEAVENNLKNKDSIYYPGERYEKLLDFNNDNDRDNERYLRITDQHERYYSYLYTGLFIREILAGWDRSGFPIDTKPGVIATLFNLGFDKSVPKPDPQIGGAIIEIDGKSYTFGGLAESVYYSNEFIDLFPKSPK